MEKAGVLALLAGVLAVGISTIHQSLWLNEAWVANSVRADSLTDLFWSPVWLQTTPPLFLLAAKAAIAVAGLSTETLRTVPLLFYLGATVAMWLAGRQILSPPFAVAGASLLAFHSGAIDVFLSFKQYGGEAAAAGLVLWATFRYLKDPSAQRFGWLLAILVGLLPLAYPLVFLVPGMVLAVGLTGSRPIAFLRAGLLAGATAAAFLVLYLAFIHPNTNPNLFTFWKGASISLWSRNTAAVAAVALLPAIRLTARVIKKTPFDIKDWAEFIFLSALPFLYLGDWLGQYPLSTRTHLFFRPALILVGLLYAQRTLNWLTTRSRTLSWTPTTMRNWMRAESLSRIVLAVAILYMGVHVRTQVNLGELSMNEDYDTAVTWLAEHLRPQDILLTHASTQQGLELYAAIHGWDVADNVKLKLGNTGWPCCPRGIDAHFGSSNDSDIRADLVRLLGPKPTGRIYNFYTDRFLHWQYTGFDEGLFTTKWLEANGCRAAPRIKLPNLIIWPLDCGSSKP